MPESRVTPKHKSIELYKWIAVILVGLMGFSFLAWLYIPAVREFSIGKKITPTTVAATSTATPVPTSTSTLEPSSTPTPVPSQTPFPASAYLINVSALDPALPGAAGEAIVLDDDVSVTPDPDFSSLRWTNSSQIAEQLGVPISNPYHATFGPGSLIWMMDKPLPKGAYEIYVLDTVYSSAGSYDFTIKLGENTLSPLTSTNTVTFLSTRGDPAQKTDLWRNLGIYYLADSEEKLSISTSWMDLAENEIVAADRVLIVPLPESDYSMLQGLPSDRMRFIIDDTQASMEGVGFLVPVSGMAWNNEFHTIVNPTNDVHVVWEYPELLPVGTYEIVAWIPENNGDLGVTYRVRINDQEEPRSDGQDLTFLQGRRPGGQWVSLGTWTTPRIYEKPVQMAVELSIPANTTGEAGIDAIAFLYRKP